MATARRSGGTGGEERPPLAGGERLRRTVDRASGGGPKYHPHSFEDAQRLLTPQVSHLQEEVAEMPAALRGARVIFEATVLPNYLANSYFPRELFEEADLVPLGTRATVGQHVTAAREPEERPTKTYLVAGDERSLQRVSELLSGAGPERGRMANARDRLRQFAEVRLPTPQEVVRPSAPGEPAEDLITWEAVLHPAVAASGRFTEEEEAGVFEKWVSFVESLGGEIATDFRRRLRGVTFVPVRLPVDAGEAAAGFNPLRAIRPMPVVRPIPGTPLRLAPTGEVQPQPPAGQRPESDLRVAVFDGGVDNSGPYLAPFVTSNDLSTEPAEDEGVAHGTLVTSAVLYGPMDPGSALATPAVHVDHYRVLPIPGHDPWDVDLYWILDRIEETLRAHEYQLVNLSLGPDLTAEIDDEPHAWTATLDALAEERGILFVTAAGNNGDLDTASGLDRVQVPADMINGLGVGACDRRAPTGSWRRCGYSAVGPGRAGARIQPVGVAFGGNEPGEPFRGVGSDSRLWGAAGTSFAAPTVVHGLSALAAALGDARSTANNLRAFAVHFAEPPEEGIEPEEVGYGRLLERYGEIWAGESEEVTVLYEDSIERNEVVSLPLALPLDAVAGRTLSIRWTLVYSTVTDPTDAVDYGQAGLESAFRPHARRFRFIDQDSGRSLIRDTVADADEVAALLRLGYQPSSVPVTRSPERVRNEAMLREEGKWETTVRSAVRMRASGLLEPQITVSYLAREQGSLLADASSLDYTLVLTVRAPRGVDLYGATRQQFQILDPVRAEIPLRVRP